MTRHPFVQAISLHRDSLPITIESARPGPRRETVRHERSRVERRFVYLAKVTL